MSQKKLMWISQSTTATTGLAGSSRNILNGLKKKFEVINVGYNFEPRNTKLLGIDYKVIGLDLRGNTDPNMLGDQVRTEIINYEPDIAVFFGDIRYFLYLPTIVRDLSNTLLVGYITTDCSNLPIHWLPTVSSFDRFIVTSQFAADEIKKVFDRDSLVVYLGHDPKIFNLESKKRISGLEDKKLVALRIDRNQTRKNWAATLDIWNKWSQDKDVNLIIHTQLKPEDGAAPNLKNYLYNLENFRTKATTSAQYIMKDKDYVSLMKGADVFITTTMGEGFGLPILEAAACGIPTIGTDFSASGELIRNGAGVAIPPAAFYANQEGVKMALSNNYEFMVALDKIYSDKRYLKELSERAAEWAKPYTWDRTIELLMKEICRKGSIGLFKIGVMGGDGIYKNLALERII